MIGYKAVKIIFLGQNALKLGKYNSVGRDTAQWQSPGSCTQYQGKPQKTTLKMRSIEDTDDFSR